MVTRGRVRRNAGLAIWMNGERVGTWSRTTANVDVFTYEEEWLRSPYGRPLSLSLPFLPGNAPHRGDHVRNWFENLLPDSNEIRSRIARRYGTRNDVQSLLSEIGRDCVGAVQILALDQVPESSDLDKIPLTDEDVARTLRTVTSDGAFSIDETTESFRISVAGAQEKTALLRIGGRWYRPGGSTPTTHLLKLPLGLVGSMRYDLAHSVENEWLCLRLLQELGFPVPEAEIASFSDDVSTERALVVKRFDRQWISQDTLLRLPQEDFCQATGIHLDQKYENEGGPGVDRIVELLRAGNNPEADIHTFVLSQLAFWLLAAIDGHAKNFSIFLLRNGHRLTPLYDVLSAWPFIGAKPNQLAIQDATLAMSVGCSKKRYKLNSITTRHWRCISDRTGVGFDEMERLVESVESAIARAESKLPHLFPAPVWEPITAGLRKQVTKFRLGASQSDATLPTL